MRFVSYFTNYTVFYYDYLAHSCTWKYLHNQFSLDSKKYAFLNDNFETKTFEKKDAEEWILSLGR